MTSANVDTTKKGAAAQDRARLSLHRSGEATEQAVTQLVHTTYGAVMSLVPPVLARPTRTVELVFDLLDQVLDAGRRAGVEIAQLVEAGFEGVDAREREARAA